ncbi:MAG: hypothetical protein ABIP74_05375 [Candidatus Saccharimonas sp.]
MKMPRTIKLVVVRPILSVGRSSRRLATHLGHKFAATDRICKKKGCTRPLFFWQNGKYCSLHSRSHRVHTVLVVVVEPQRQDGAPTRNS